MAEVRLELLADEVYLLLGRLTMVCVVTELIGSTRQYMVLIVKDKDQSTI